MGNENMISEGSYPAVEQSQEEQNQIKRRQGFGRVLGKVVCILIAVAAAAALLAALVFPVLKVYGSGMEPLLTEGDIVISFKSGGFKTGDITAFYFNNKILIKRVIAQGGDWVDIDEDGNVYVNNVAVDEPYLTEKALGDCNIQFPYQVPESRVFVMGDRRSVSVDSRNTTVGCVAEEQIIGKIVFCVWPINKFGPV